MLWVLTGIPKQLLQIKCGSCRMRQFYQYFLRVWKSRPPMRSEGARLAVACSSVCGARLGPTSPVRRRLISKFPQILRQARLDLLLICILPCLQRPLLHNPSSRLLNEGLRLPLIAQRLGYLLVHVLGSSPVRTDSCCAQCAIYSLIEQSSHQKCDYDFLVSRLP